MAGLTTTQSFSDGDTVTAAKLNNIIANCSIDDDAITTVKINDGDVTLAKMAALSVDTGQLVGLAVSNAKLAGMTRGTVKVGNSSGAASDLDAKTDNAFLTGDGTDIKSKTFDSATAGDIEITSTASNFYLEIASNSIANAMVKDDAINPAKLSPSSDSNPGVIVYGGSGTPAEVTTTATGSVLSSNGAGAPTWTSSSPLMAKAWVEFTGTTSDGAITPTYSSNISALARTTNAGEYTIEFDTNFPSDNYTAIATGWTTSSNDIAFGRITARVSTGASCTVKYGNNESVTSGDDPTGGATIVFFGSTS